jgi:hypothetical protein
MNRRQALRLISVTPFIGTLEWCPDDVRKAALQVDELAASPFAPQYFTEPEWRTVNVLVDIISPRDERSGSATDAKVPEFMDFMLNEASEQRQTMMRDGLRWLDDESQRRFTAAFADAAEAQRTRILDDVAFPDRAPEALADAVSFFNSFRDLTASGFFSSRMGYDDLGYIGNQPMREFPGCPEPALRKLGVSYDLMQARRG